MTSCCWNIFQYLEFLSAAPVKFVAYLLHPLVIFSMIVAPPQQADRIERG